MINENILKGQWKEIQGELKKKWGQLTDDDLEQVQGDSTKLEGLLQTKLGIGQEKARTELESFLDRWTNAPSQKQFERDF